MSTRSLKFTAFVGFMLLGSIALGQSDTRIRDPFANVPNAFTQEYVQKIENDRATIPAQQVSQPRLAPKLDVAPTQNQQPVFEQNSERIVMSGDVQWANHLVGNNYPKFGDNTGHLPLGTAGHFMFSSARQKRNYLGGSDFDSIPCNDCACDEWQNFCQCDNCRTQWGADFWRPRWGSWFHHGSKHGCWNGNCK